VDRLLYWSKMALAKITREGLVTIAVLVAILWGCILTERVLSRNTSIETYRVFAPDPLSEVQAACGTSLSSRPAVSFTETRRRIAGFQNTEAPFPTLPLEFL